MLATEAPGPECARDLFKTNTQLFLELESVKAVRKSNSAGAN